MHHPPHLDIDIDKLITDENDPKFRVLLMLVKSLSDYLAGNTEAVNDMSKGRSPYHLGLWPRLPLN